MIDLKPIEPYIIKDNSHQADYSIFVIARIGFKEWFDSQLSLYCDCSKTFKDGRRCIQTNDKRYNYEITNCVKMIEQFGEDEKDEYYTKLITQHQKNLEFEKINGFEYNPCSKKKERKTLNKVKNNSNKNNNKEKKETVAEKKLKAHALKLNSVIFKPKTINNDNSL